MGKPTRKPRPTRVQVVSNDAVRSDATVDSGTADEAAVAQTRADVGADGTPTASTRTESLGDAGPGKPDPSKEKLNPVHEVPDDAVSYTTSDGTQFYAPPDADFRKVYAAGQASGGDRKIIGSALGQFGTYDFQRRDGNFYYAYMNASNYAVGVYMAGAGYSLLGTLSIGTGYGMTHSANWDSDFLSHIVWWTKGWTDATSGSWPVSHL